MRFSIKSNLLIWLPLLSRASNDFGARFLQENAKKYGVVETASGLQYKVLRQGKGIFSPSADSLCVVDYEGRTAENYPSGPKFDSTYDRHHTLTFAPNQVIKGWSEAMQLMVEGDQWELYIASELAYGDQGRPPSIPGGAVLVFQLEMREIKGKRHKRAPALPKGFKQWCNLTYQPPKIQLAPIRYRFNVSNLVGAPSESSFVMEVHPDWAPKGSSRLMDLIGANFFNDARFYHVVPGYGAQFGINGDPAIMKRWGECALLDDEAKPGIGNKPGAVSFMVNGPNTRSTQLFINFKENLFLDGMGYVPVARIIQGLDVAIRLFPMGEGAPAGPGPSMDSMKALGNAYLQKQFPNLSYVKSCSPTTQGAGDGGVKNIGSGLKMVVLKEGDGKTYPRSGDFVTIHYVLRLAGARNGIVIRSSRKQGKPLTFKVGLGEVIRGWDIGVLHMSLGQRSTLMVPYQLGYGGFGAGNQIPPNTNLLYEIEIMGIKSPPKPKKAFIAKLTGHPLVIVGLLAVTAVLLCCVYRKIRNSSEFRALRITDDEMTIGQTAPE